MSIRPLTPFSLVEVLKQVCAMIPVVVLVLTLALTMDYFVIRACKLLLDPGSVGDATDVCVFRGGDELLSGLGFLLRVFHGEGFDW
ncbi:hypothetical protein BDW72DRAFT_187498 [Aspergillus terricola var. indicus]